MACILVLATATCTDLTRRMIPNALTVSTAVSGLAYHLLGLPTGEGVWFAVAGCGIGSLLLFAPYRLGWVGAGDVKLLAALGTWLGPAEIVRVFICATLAGGIMSVGWLIRHRRTARPKKEQAGSIAMRRSPRPAIQGLPYALAISGGYLAHLTWSALP
jgi:prepilin peptidase CpaA